MKEVIVEKQKQKKWEFRRLKGKDIFLMLPVLKKIGINNIKKCFNGDIVKDVVATNKGKAYDTQIEAATFGAMLEFGQVLIEGLDACENEIFNLLEKTSNLRRNEIEELDFLELPEMIMDFVKKEEFKDFLQVAQRFIKSAT